MSSCPNRLVRIGNGSQKPQESLLEIRNFVGAVRCRIAVEIDPKLTTVRSVIQNDGQVFDWTVCEVVGRSGMPTETQVIIERHEIDRRTEHTLVGAKSSRIPP